MTVLEAKDLTVRRGGRAILDGVSLRFAQASLVAVVGPNGAGKSTLLRTLAGLARPDGGQVELDGAPLVAGQALARRRAYLPQNALVEWPLAVERVVALGLTPLLPPFGELPEAMRRQVDKALAACDLEAQRGQAATTLSGGELARTMLARALVGEPEILIVDEPTTGLDLRHALETLERLRALGDQGRLVIAAIHDLTLAGRYADRVVVLDKGKVIADGAPAVVLNPGLLRSVFQVEARIVDGLVDVRRAAP